MRLFHRRLAYAFTTFLLLTGSTTLGQTNVAVYEAALAVPFGVAEGYVLLREDSLIFVDSAQPEASFEIPRSAISRLDHDNDVISIETDAPVRDRSGDRQEFRVRMAQGDAVARWYAESTGALMAAGTAPAAGTQAGESSPSYQVKHDHLIGGCEGRLIITANRLAFESVTRADDSQQWAFADIRELKQDGIYKLEVQPFVGDAYNFELIGRGMDSETYRELVDQVAQKRVGP